MRSVGMGSPRGDSKYGRNPATRILNSEQRHEKGNQHNAGKIQPDSGV